MLVRDREVPLEEMVNSVYDWTKKKRGEKRDVEHKKMMMSDGECLS